MKINDLTGEIVDEVAPIRKRVEALDGEVWFGKAQMGASSVQDILVTLDDEDYVVAEHVGDPNAAEFISHAPEDMRFLLERLDRVEALLKEKRDGVCIALHNEKHELSKGRVRDSFYYATKAERLKNEADALEVALYGA